MNSKRLKIAYLIEDEYSDASISMKNTVQEVVNFLRKEGHELEEFPMKDLREMQRVSELFTVSFDFIRIMQRF